LGLIYQSFISFALLIAMFLVASFFAYIYSIKRQNYLLLWTAAWFVFGLHYIFPAVPSSLENALTHWLFGLSAVLFFLGAQIYAQRKPWKLLALLVVSLLGLWAAANAANKFSVSAVIPASLLYLAVADMIAKPNGSDTWTLVAGGAILALAAVPAPALPSRQPDS